MASKDEAATGDGGDQPTEQNEGLCAESDKLLFVLQFKFDTSQFTTFRRFSAQSEQEQAPAPEAVYRFCKPLFSTQTKQFFTSSFLSK